MKHGWFFVCAVTVGLIASGAMAQDYQTTGPDGWIESWLMLGLVTNTGGFDASATHDYISEGTGGAASHESVSTQGGVRATQDMVVSLPDNGGDLTWEVLTIDPADGNNMSTVFGFADESDTTTHAILVVASPTAQNAVLNPAHDDYAQIWINGDLVYDNPCWTGGAQIVTTPTDVSLRQGGNVLLYKCGESGGSDYFNLFIDAANLDILPTVDEQFFQHLDSVSVDPKGKLATEWAEIKIAR